jgi:hypothetical protein
MFGTDPEDIWTNLTIDTPEIRGLFLPPLLECTSDFLTGITFGTQKALSNGSELNPYIPNHHYFGLKYLIPFISMLPHVLEYMPETWYKTGECKDTLKLPNKEFIYQVFATVDKVKFDEF